MINKSNIQDNNNNRSKVVSESIKIKSNEKLTLEEKIK